MQAPILETQRLRLRGHVASDLDTLCDLFETERSAHMGGPVPRIFAWRWLASEVAMWELMGHGAWGIEDKDGAFLGQIGLMKPPHFPEVEIGWTLLEAAEGKGYAFEAAQAVLAWGWANGLTTLVSYIAPENARSIALAKRLGATHDLNAPLPEGETANDTHVYRHTAPTEALRSFADTSDADGSPEAYA